MPHITLDSRLSLAYDLYDSCSLAADIGTDHAHLPAALLQRGRCQRMILTDISKSALENARSEIVRRRLGHLVSLRLGSGLSPVDEKCEMISIMGMGGRTIRDILLSGQDRLQGASLLLSAHTDWPLIRGAVQDIGYHLEKEEPCFDSGRYYLIMLARPGAGSLSAQEIRLGRPLFQSASPILNAFVERRCTVLEESLRGLLSAAAPDETRIAMLRGDLAFCRSFLSGRK